MDNRTQRAISLYARVVRAERRLEKLKAEWMDASTQIPSADMLFYVTETTRLERTSGTNVWPRSLTYTP